LVQDVIIAAQNTCTAADALGLGSCYIGTIIEYIEEAAEMFQLPQQVMPVVLVVFGYPSTQPDLRKKLPANFMVHDEKYAEPNPGLLFEAYTERENHRHIQVNDELLKDYLDTCVEVGGINFANEAEQLIRQRGWLSPIQHRFGLHYNAAFMPQHNMEFLEAMKKRGFHFFEEYKA
jgi:hypothetical protein